MGSGVKKAAAIVVILIVGAGLLHWLWVFDARQGQALESRGAIVSTTL
jgi:hypothetical protein